MASINKKSLKNITYQAETVYISYFSEACEIEANIKKDIISDIIKKLLPFILGALLVIKFGIYQ